MSGCMKEEVDFLRARDCGCEEGDNLPSIGVIIEEQQPFELGEVRDISYTLPEDAPEGLLIGLILNPPPASGGLDHLAVQSSERTTWDVALDTVARIITVAAPAVDWRITPQTAENEIAVYSTDRDARTAIKKLPLKLDYTGIGADSYFFERGVVVGLVYADWYDSEYDWCRVYHIVSLYESPAGMQWSTAPALVNSTSREYCDANLLAYTAYKTANSTPDFPAFEYCIAQGSEWLLPTHHDMAYLFCEYIGYWRHFWEGLFDDYIPTDTYYRDRFNQKLVAVGGTPLSDGTYWTSTEDNDPQYQAGKAMSINFATSEIAVSDKTSAFQVRPVRIWVDWDDCD